MMETSTVDGRKQDALFTGVPEGYDARVVADLAKASGSGDAPGLHLHVVRDDRRLQQLEAALAFFAPEVKVAPFPAWDTVPYDRTSPNSEIVARRITTLGRLAIGARKAPMLVLTTVNAILQRAPPRAFIRQAFKPIAPGQRLDMTELDCPSPSLRISAHRRRDGARRIRAARRHPRSLSAGAHQSDPARFLRRSIGDDQSLRRGNAADDEAGHEIRADAGERTRVRRRGDGAVSNALCRAVRRQHERRSAL